MQAAREVTLPQALVQVRNSNRGRRVFQRARRQYGSIRFAEDKSPPYKDRIESQGEPISFYCFLSTTFRRGCEGAKVVIDVNSNDECVSAHGVIP